MKKYPFAVGHILLSYTEFKGEVPAPLRLKYAVGDGSDLNRMPGELYGLFVSFYNGSLSLRLANNENENFFLLSKSKVFLTALSPAATGGMPWI